MNLNLFNIEEKVKPIQTDEMVMSLSFDETQIIRWIMVLHNGGSPFDVDATYSTGRFWKGLPGPKYRFDINPQAEDVTRADARALPLRNASMQSVMFDPPFVVGSHNDGFKDGIIKSRFSYFGRIYDLWQFYKNAIVEFYGILVYGGILVVKCQDTISGGRQYMSHFEIMKYAYDLGFYLKDLFILGRTKVIWSPNMANQQHARKNHCYFLVFRKI